MTHEFKHLIDVAWSWQQKNKKSVLATVVCLEGSSYRSTGVQMLIGAFGEMIGAVSGGCVEKEVYRQAESVFKTEIPKVMTYDGRYRLGCEGVLYILLEPLVVTEALYRAIEACFRYRKIFQSTSYFKPEYSQDSAYGTVLEIENTTYSLRTSFSEKVANHLQKFKRQFQPVFQLYIFGAEHDAVQLCELANKIGWEVHIIASPDEQKTKAYFKGATSLSAPFMETIDVSNIGEHTAVVLMSHSLNKDVQYLLALKDTRPDYIGMLGSSKRRERIFSEFLNVSPDTPYEFLESIHGPTGLNIGAETPAEIALSVIAEILSVIRKTEVMPLREKTGRIHD